VSAAADFVDRFRAYWRAPSVEGLGTLLAPDVRLVAPMTPTTHTLEEGKRAFAGILALAPDLTGEVHRWGATDDGVLIEFTLSGSVAGTAMSWRAVDRIVLRDDGLATERVSYFDPTPIVLLALRHPRTWPAFARSRLRRRGFGSPDPATVS
jgi:SnoaL-like domain